jgi:hypothetical protein
VTNTGASSITHRHIYFAGTLIAGPARNAVMPVASGKSGRLREAYLYV